MSPTAKNHILDLLEGAGSLIHTKEVLGRLYVEIMSKLSDIESEFGVTNVILRELLVKIRL